MTDRQHFTSILQSPVGYLGVQMEGKKLIGLAFLGKQEKSGFSSRSARASEKESEKVRNALAGYFSNPYTPKQPEIELRGTEFQQKIWSMLSLIRPGQTRTYGDIARELKTSARAVGNACRKNPVPIFIPCHRVVSRTGKGGFMGHTTGEPLEIKNWLLAHEQKAASGE